MVRTVKMLLICFSVFTAGALLVFFLAADRIKKWFIDNM
jgi:hypothetical protein